MAERAQAPSSTFEPEIVLLYCQHCVGGGVRPVDSIRNADGFTARTVVMPCSSKVESRQIVKLLEKGADGIQIVGCPDGSCRFLVGSNRAERRVAYVRGLLEEIDYGAERVGIAREADLTEEGLMALAAERADKVRPLGRSAMKERDVSPETMNLEPAAGE
jgi:F420-non-reducing hydrogenase iron-sulfur subunit